jgi:NAD+ synthase (glutamine-hydrolysing)
VARKYNELKGTDVIPENILNKAPSAELKFNQTDQDTLPPYELLDEILFRYIEREMSIDELIESGYEKDMIKKIIKMVDNNEYKRRQSAPGIKLTERNFGKDRRLPLTNGYKIWEKY